MKTCQEGIEILAQLTPHPRWTNPSKAIQCRAEQQHYIYTLKGNIYFIVDTTSTKLISFGNFVF